MDPEAVMSLFDTCWFNYEILNKNQSSTKYSYKSKQSCSPSGDPKFSSLRSILVRSHSEDMGNSFNYGSFSPNSVLFIPTLKSIPSLDFKPQKQEENQVAEDQEETPKADLDQFEHNILQEKNKNKKKKKIGGRMSKSLSDVEFDELKGFMDLGFVFSEEDKADSSLVKIIPDLQRLGERDGDDERESDDKSSRRPNLSEVWKDLDGKMEKKREQKPVLMMNLKWEVPAISDEIDMKDHLKLWAHTVASIVR